MIASATAAQYERATRVLLADEQVDSLLAIFTPPLVTQADDVAMEDANLKQGLLTYALAAEGLGPTGGLADLDSDRQIRLNEWLTYAVQRMPSLGQDDRVAQIGRGITFHDLTDNTPKRRVQQPSLFDFNREDSPVILRRIAA